MKFLVGLVLLLSLLLVSGCSDSEPLPPESSKPYSWNYDSVGAYYANEGQYTHILAQKISLLWEYRDSAEVVCMGNSHTMSGVNPDWLRHFAINLSTVPCDLHCMKYLYENYVSLHAKELKYLVIGMDFDLWNECDSMDAVQVNFGDAAGFQYDMHHQFWRDGVDSLFVNRVVEIAKTKLENEDREYKQMCEHRGWMSMACVQDWASDGKGVVEILEDSTAYDDGVRYESNFSELSRILEIAKSQNVIVVGVVFPISPYYRNTGSYGRHGMRRSTAEMLLKRLEKLAETDKNFVLMDENQMGSHDYAGRVANDYDHLCGIGAKKLTLRLDSLLNVLDGKM